MKQPPPQIEMGYFTKDDKEISTTRAAELLRCSTTSVHHKIEDGTIRAYRKWEGGHYRVSQLSVLRVLQGISKQIAQTSSPLGRTRDSGDF